MNNSDKKMYNTKLHIGVIGLGRMGLMHAAVFNGLENSKVIAISDPSKFPAKPLGEINPSIRVYKDAVDMINNEELDGVLISSPVSSHVSFSP